MLWILFILISCTLLFGMQDNDSNKLFNLFEHAAACDREHQVLSETPQPLHEGSWWHKASPLLQGLWAADHTFKTNPPAWESFVAWYTDYIRNRIGDMNAKLKNGSHYDLPFGYPALHNNPQIMHALIKLNIPYDPTLYTHRRDPLFLAKSTYIAKQLIVLGANVNAKDTRADDFPLSHAARYKDIPWQVVELYLQSGAIINPDTNGYNALHWLCLYSDNYERNPDACIKKAELLIQAGVHTHKIGNGSRPLDLALSKRDEARRWLHAERNKENQSTKDWCKKRLGTCTQLIEFLQSKGAHGWGYIDDDLSDLQDPQITPEYRKKELARHKKDIAAMYLVLKTSKTSSQGHAVIKAFADWYTLYLDNILKTVDLNYQQPQEFPSESYDPFGF